MSDYIKITDYAAKDNLLTGDPAKLVKGSEIGADFDAVAVAVATKYDSTDLGVTIQAYSSNLDEYAAVNPTTAGLALLDDATASDQLTTLGVSAFAKSFLDDADEATFKQTVNLEIGVDVQAYDATIINSSAIGVTVQGYDADTAKTDVAQNFTAPQRSALLTDNDGSFDLSAKQNFKSTPTAGFTLTFTNQADGVAGTIILVNGSNYAIAAHANTKISSTALARISATGTYRIDYISDGTNCYCTASESLA